MLKFREYVRAESLEDAYVRNQKKSAHILGGMLWLKMQNRTVQTVIDLSDLGLSGIEETEEEYRIGAMTSLRELELHKGLDRRSRPGEPASHRGRPVPEPGHRGRQYFRTVWIF